MPDDLADVVREGDEDERHLKFLKSRRSVRSLENVSTPP